MVNVSNISGCCVGLNFYNLGGAHGYRTAANLQEFEDRLLAAGTFSTINTAITNRDQGKTREYLEACGFKTFDMKQNGIYISTINGKDFGALRQRISKRQQEEKARKKEIEKKRQEEIRAKMKFSKSTDKINPAFDGIIREVDVRRLLNGILPYQTTSLKQREDMVNSLHGFYGDIRLHTYELMNDLWGQNRDWVSLRRYIYDRYSRARRFRR